MSSASDDRGSDKAAARLEATVDLLQRARAGDRLASNQLFDRFYPILKRLARGRLPQSLRDLKDTDDLVQETLVRAFKRLGEFEYRREGAFLAYLRQILLNQIREEIRRKKVRPTAAPLTESHFDPGRTPSQIASEDETRGRFETALLDLTEEQREVVIMRVDFGYSYDEIARATGKPSPNAARMVVARALARVAKSMGAERGGSN